MLKKIIGLGLISIMIFSLCSCGNGSGDGGEKPENPIEKYNAVMHHNAGGWIDAGFLNRNKTYGAYYGDEQLLDESYPAHRTFIVKAQNEFDEIFTTFPPGIDFEKEILFLHIITSLYGAWASSYKLTRMTVENLAVKIEFKLEVTPGMGENARPHQRCLAVKMDKFDMDTVEFTELV